VCSQPRLEFSFVRNEMEPGGRLSLRCHHPALSRMGHANSQPRQPGRVLRVTTGDVMEEATKKSGSS
jgi:hypothetical protein